MVNQEYSFLILWLWTSYEVYSRNASCALISLSTFFYYAKGYNEDQKAVLI